MCIAAGKANSAKRRRDVPSSNSLCSSAKPLDFNTLKSISIYHLWLCQSTICVASSTLFTSWVVNKYQCIGSSPKGTLRCFSLAKTAFMVPIAYRTSILYGQIVPIFPVNRQATILYALNNGFFFHPLVFYQTVISHFFLASILKWRWCSYFDVLSSHLLRQNICDPSACLLKIVVAPFFACKYNIFRDVYKP